MGAAFSSKKTLSSFAFAIEFSALIPIEGDNH